MPYQYNTFSGLARERTAATAGQSIHLTFSTEVTKGSLSVEIKDPRGNSVWHVNVPEHQNRNGTAEIRAALTGRYQVVITGLDTGGRFDVRWRVR